MWDPSQSQPETFQYNLYTSLEESRYEALHHYSEQLG